MPEESHHLRKGLHVDLWVALCLYLPANATGQAAVDCVGTVPSGDRQFGLP